MVRNKPGYSCGVAQYAQYPNIFEAEQEAADKARQEAKEKAQQEAKEKAQQEAADKGQNAGSQRSYQLKNSLEILGLD